MDMTIEDVKEAVREVLHEEGVLGHTMIADKWKGGRLYFEPRDPNQQGKEIPVEVFFHKIVMLRDKLRVMEQKINADKALSEESKVNLQQYITGIYGTLTTFNVLFKFKDDQFTGQRGG